MAVRAIMPKPRKLKNVLYLRQINTDKDNVALFRIAKQIRKQNQDIIGEKCVKQDDNKLIYSDTENKNACK